MSKSEADLYHGGADHDRIVASRRAVAASWILAGIAAALLVAGPAAGSSARAAIVAVRHEASVVATALHDTDAAVGHWAERGR
jgi:hypothetical protein